MIHVVDVGELTNLSLNDDIWSDDKKNTNNNNVLHPKEYEEEDDY